MSQLGNSSNSVLKFYYEQDSPRELVRTINSRLCLLKQIALSLLHPCSPLSHHRTAIVSQLKPKSGHVTSLLKTLITSHLRNRYRILTVTYQGFCVLPSPPLFLSSPYTRSHWPLCRSWKLLPQDLCTCCHHCLECISFRYLHDLHLHFL